MDPKFSSEWSAYEIEMAKSLILTCQHTINNSTDDPNRKHNAIVHELQTRFPWKENNKIIDLYVEIMTEIIYTTQNNEPHMVASNGLVMENFSMTVEEQPQMNVVVPRQHRQRTVRFWTKEEHRNFLRGLIMYGRGNWKDISRHFVPSKTAVQVSSHAQKYFRRQERTSVKKRHSINDVGLYDAEPWAQNNSRSLGEHSFVGDAYNPSSRGSTEQLFVMNNPAHAWSPLMYSATQMSSSLATTSNGGQQTTASSFAPLTMEGDGSQMAWTDQQHGDYLPQQWMGMNNMY